MGKAGGFRFESKESCFNIEFCTLEYNALGREHDARGSRLLCSLSFAPQKACMHDHET